LLPIPSSDVFFDRGSWPAASKGAPPAPPGCSRSRRFNALSARRRRTDAQLDETIETTVADSADNPEIALQKKSRGELVRAAMMKRSADRRDILDLVYYHENSVEDCASVGYLAYVSARPARLCRKH
jgi:RNA polymerase sigma-70 factor, ECF subfamily